jgi:uncharacterized protein with HEPN domain
MKQRKVLPRLHDIVGAIEEIEDYLTDNDFGRFQKDRMTYRAVERALEIISEARRQIPDELTAQHTNIPWVDVRTIGNILRHEYQRVAPLVIWQTAEKSLTQLKSAIKSMIADVQAQSQKPKT